MNSVGYKLATGMQRVEIQPYRRSQMDFFIATLYSISKEGVPMLATVSLLVSTRSSADADKPTRCI